ncbi:MAG: double zinc ribbon domain-containing protein, partial [Vicinamibacteria bacterium]
IIASATIGVVAQRLVRRLCSCRRQYTPEPDVLRALNIPEAEAAALPFYKAVGCEHCHHTGYRGRIGIYEVMRVTDRLRRMIAQRASEEAIREAAQASGMMTLGEDALAKVKSGVTTPEELLRVVTEVKDIRSACPGCGSAVALDFLVCPGCGRRLGGGCPGCGRAMQAGWTYCPYCARSHESRRDRRLREAREVREIREVRELPPANVAEFKKGPL